MILLWPWCKRLFLTHSVCEPEAGSSSSPCSDSYAGTSPFSETETETLSSYLSSISNSLLVYFSFHSYSQLLMFPYGYTQEHVSNYEELVSYIFVSSFQIAL
jgi:hypothetical protein